jgi:hypothetical protein
MWRKSCAFGLLVWPLVLQAQSLPLMQEEQSLRMAYWREPTGARLDALRRWREAARPAPRSEAQAAYRDGCNAWMDGRVDDARNGWYRALRLNDMDGGLPPAEASEARLFFDRAESIRIPPAEGTVVVPVAEPIDALISVAVPAEKAKPVKPHRRRPSRRKSTGTVSVPRVPVDVDALLAKAQRAAESGHLEAAFRALRAAQRARPDRADIAERIAALQMEMGSSSR